MAEAGFYTVPHKYFVDMVKCFHCGVELINWSPSDDPVYDHKNASPSCAYINLMYPSNNNSIVNDQACTGCIQS